MRLTPSQLNEIHQILHAMCKIGCNICPYHNNYDKCMNYITFHIDEIVKIVSRNPRHSDHEAFITSTGRICVSWLSASRSSYRIVYQPIDGSAPFGGRQTLPAIFHSYDEALTYYHNWLASHERPASPESIVNKFLINEGKTLTKE